MLKNQLESCEPISKEEYHLKERLIKEFQNQFKNIEQKSFIATIQLLLFWIPNSKDSFFLDKVVL